MTTDQSSEQISLADAAPADAAPADAAPAPFPTVQGRRKGYEKAAVNAFMARARAAFEADAVEREAATDAEAVADVQSDPDAEPGEDAVPDEDAEPGEDAASETGAAPEAGALPAAEPPFDAAAVRLAAFPLVRGGYVISAVDGALGRLEDAFAARERDQRLAEVGASVWIADARLTAQEILDRLSRPAKRKFGRTGVLRFGYRVDEVDLVAGKLITYFEAGDQISVEQVRQAAFRMQRAGYREEQVDALLDAVVEVMLAVR